jgi:hypothetical protein
MRFGNAARTALKALMAVIACSLASGPILSLAVLAGYAIGIYPSLAAYSQKSLSSLLIEWLTIAIGTFPITTAIALGMHVLSRMRRDSFILAVAAGGVTGYAALCMLEILIFGRIQSFRFGVSFNLVLAAVNLGFCMSLSALYWLLAVKGKSRRRMLAEQQQQAIRAME